MKIVVPGILCLLLAALFANAQKPLPVLKSNTHVVDIKESNSRYRNIWTVNASVPLDTFVTNIFKEKIDITFYSDIDSLHFSVQPNKKYNFIILVNGKDTAYTQINTSKKLQPSLIPKLTYTSTRTTNDTISFVVGKDHRPYFNGSINNTDSLRFLFDLNAGINVIDEAVVAKANVKADEIQENRGSDGIAKLKKSNSNQLIINGLKWENVPLLIVPYKERSFDAVFSWKSLEDKVFEINYDKNIIVIHKTMPQVPADYSKLPIEWIDGNPFVKCSLQVGEKVVEGWFGFDTGSDGEIDISQHFAAEHQLNDRMKKIGSVFTSGSSGGRFGQRIVELPKLRLGEFELYNVPLGIYEKDPEGITRNEILGNNILNRFNTIVDFSNNIIYLKPNTRLYTPFK